MKKRMYLMIAVVMLTILTACGADKEHGESAEQAGYEMPGDKAGTEESDSGTEVSGNKAGTEEPDPGTETPGDGAGTEEPNLGTTESGENEVFPERAYEPDIIYYSETSEGYHLRKDVEKTQTDYAVYYFELPIGEQERNECIAATDGMLSCIDAALPEIEVVVLQQKSYDGVSISGSRLYLSPQPWDSLDYLAKVLLAGYGGWGNYGLAYGYADYLCRKAGPNSGEADPDGREADGFLPMSAPELYDLTLLCFNEKFVSPGDVEASKNNASLFVEDYLSSHSEGEFLELLSASGTVEGVAQANEALEAFYAENGVECSLTEVLYQYGGVLSDYAVACEYARFYIYKDWQDLEWKKNPTVSENFLHEDYGEVRRFFEYHVDQMRYCQEFFGFDSYNNDLTVFLKNRRVVPKESLYLGRQHKIYLEFVSAMMHEYIHSVMYGRFADWGSGGKCHWKVEGFATYFSCKYNLYRYEHINDNWNSSSSIIWVQKYIDSIGRPIDYRTDFRDLDDLCVYIAGETDPNTSYVSGASFVGYLADQYGEQAVIAYVCSDNDYNAEWDKSYDELVQDWRKYIKDNYSQYSKDTTQ